VSATFLGKWTIRSGDAVATYKAKPPATEEFGLLMWPNPPGNSANIAFILRDGKIFLLLNDGHYLAYWDASGAQYLTRMPLEHARGFTFPGQDPRWLPATFTGLIQCTEFGSYLQAGPGSVGVVAEKWATQFTMTQVSPLPANVLSSGRDNGDHLDYAWVDFSDGFGVQSGRFQCADFSHCQFPRVLQNVDLFLADLSNSNLQRIEFYQCSLKGANLANCNLTGAWAAQPPVDFTSANFTNANLTNANFAGCQMTYARLAGCNLTNTNLSGCNLIMSELTKCNLSDTNLANADLSYANLTGSTFTGTKFFNPLLASANLSGADLTEVSIDPRNLPRFYITPPSEPSDEQPRANLTQCRLNQSLLGNDWSMLDLTNATILNLSSPLSTAASPLIAKYAILKGVHNDDFSNFSLQHAVFDYAILAGFDFRGADLTGASFKGASLASANFLGAKLSGANFNHADLTGAQFKDADLTDAFFVETRLAGANFSYATLDKANFHAAQLGNIDSHSGADLSYANMHGTDFSNANLDMCTLSSAQWYGPNATGYQATLRGADLTDANLGALNLQQAHLDDAVLDDAILIGAQLNGVTAKDAKFRGAHLQGTNFTGAVLDGAKFNNAAVYLDYGVPLFHLTKSKYIVDLGRGVVSEDLRMEFTRAGCDLVDPSVAAKATGPWTLSNVAFVKFSIIQASTDRLNIYGSSPLFQLKGSYTSDLNHKTVSSDLRQEFRDAGRALGDHATVAPNPPDRWTLSNGLFQKFRIIQDSAGGLLVFPYPSDPLFQLEGSHIGDYVSNLNKGIVPLNLQSDFSANKHELTGTAWVTTGKPGWTLWNDPIIRPGSAYANFVITGDSSDILTVYGVDLWVTQVNESNESQTVIEPMTVATIWDNCTISAETVFPNGQQHLRPPFTSEMMMAHNPPKLPTCVSTGTDWLCPRNKK
jgi:uncharacterized protein YjbI with pentapeptide repeats